MNEDVCLKVSSAALFGRVPENITMSKIALVK